MCGSMLMCQYIVKAIFVIAIKIENANTSISCNTDVNFQEIPNVNALYEMKPRKCNPQVNNTCRRFKNVKTSYFEMKPFTSHDPKQLNMPPAKRSFSHGIVQHIMHIALIECCGSCIINTITKLSNHSQLCGIQSKNNSDVRFPIFTQGTSDGKSHTIPLVKLSGAVFIIKSAVAPTQFGRAVFSAIMEIWPLLGLSLLLAYISGVLIWIVDTWSNKEHFPRRFLTGAFEGKLGHSIVLNF